MVGAGWGTLGQSGDQWVGHSESASASPSHKVTFGTVFAILAMLILEEGVLIWDGEQCGWAGSTFDNNAKIHPTPRQSHFVRLGPSSSWTKGFQMDLLNECIAAAHLLCRTKTLPFILTLFTQCCWSLSFSDHHIHNHRDQGPSPLERLQRTERIWKVSSLSRWVIYPS